MSKVSAWQNGVPPCEGIWQILVKEHDNKTYYAYYLNNKWGVGVPYIEGAIASPYAPNNNPHNPRKWRGLIDD